MSGREKIHYAGDVFGYSEDGKIKVLVLGRVCDNDWLFDFNSRDIPYIPKSKFDVASIEWPPGKRLPVGVRPTFLDRPFIKIGTRVRHNEKEGFVKGKVDVGTVKLVKGNICLQGIELDRLVEITEARKGRGILLGDFIGEIETVKHKVSLAFQNGVECNIDYDRERCLYKGATFKPNYSDLRNATWTSSGFHNTAYRMIQNLGSSATIRDIAVDTLTVKWLSRLPSETKAVPPSENLSSVDYQNIRFIPERYDNPELNTLWNIVVGPTDSQNMFTSREDWLNEIVGTEGEADERKRRRLELEALEVGSTQTVQLLLIQTNIQIEYDDGTTEDIPSRDLDEILMMSSIEIPRLEYVTKQDKNPDDVDGDGQVFGLAKGYFLGESQFTPMNPMLNPSNMTEVQWFTIGRDDPRDVRATGVERISVFDLQSLGFSHALETSDYLTRRFPSDELTVGSFSKILENGRVEIKDLDGKIFQRWPSEVSIFESNVPDFVGRISPSSPPWNPELFLKTVPSDVEKASQYTIWTYGEALKTEDPIDPAEFASAVTRNIIEFSKTSNPLMHRIWICIYENKQDLLACLIMGSKESIMEDLVFSLKINLLPDFPNGSPRFSLSLSTAWDTSPLSHWDDLKSHVFTEWTPSDLILNGISKVRCSIEATTMAYMKFEDWRFPLSYVYPKLELTGGTETAWAHRWHEAIAVQSMRYVYNSIAYPSRDQDPRILSHYREILPRLMERWRSWTQNQGTLITHASEGFISSTELQLRRFEAILAHVVEKEKPRCKECGRPEDPDPDPDPEAEKNNPPKENGSKDDPKD